MSALGRLFEWRGALPVVQPIPASDGIGKVIAVLAKSILGGLDHEYALSKVAA